MTFWQRFRSVFARGKVPPADPSMFMRWPWMLTAGVNVTPETSLEIAAVYACCRVIVDSLASQPAEVYTRDSEGRKTEVVDSDIGYLLNVRPNPECTPIAVREGLYWSALTWGNGYGEIVRNGANKPTELWPLLPHTVVPRRTSAGRLFYEVTGADGQVKPLEPADVFHLRGPSLQGWIGDSQTTRAGKGIGIAMAAQAFAGSYFENGTILSGYLTTDQPLTKEQIESVGSEFHNKFGGAAKAGQVAIFQRGTKYQEAGANASEAQLLETRKFQVAEIARFYGVPLSLLMDPEGSQGYGTNVEQLYLTFSKTALGPWASRFDQEATYKFFPERKPWRCVETDLTRLTQGDFKTVIEALKLAVNSGLLTRNEARERLGWNTTGSDGDVFLVESTAKRLEDVLDPPDPQPDSATTSGAPTVKTGDPVDPAEPDEDDTEGEQPQPPTMNRARTLGDPRQGRLW